MRILLKALFALAALSWGGCARIYLPSDVFGYNGSGPYSCLQSGWSSPSSTTPVLHPDLTDPATQNLGGFPASLVGNPGLESGVMFGAGGATFGGSDPGKEALFLFNDTSYPIGTTPANSIISVSIAGPNNGSSVGHVYFRANPNEPSTFELYVGSNEVGIAVDTANSQNVLSSCTSGDGQCPGAWFSSPWNIQLSISGCGSAAEIFLNINNQSSNTLFKPLNPSQYFDSGMIGFGLNNGASATNFEVDANTTSPY